MAKIIETSLIYNVYPVITDFQSRVIEVESWDSYVKEIENASSVFRVGSLSGNSLPRESKVFNFKSDEYHLSCDFRNALGIQMKRLAYLMKNE